jgi:hypothetical protein
MILRICAIAIIATAVAAAAAAAAAPQPTSAVFSYQGVGLDKMGATYDKQGKLKHDGLMHFNETDLHFTLALKTTINRSIASIAVTAVGQTGWSTVPGASQLAVYDQTGKYLNPGGQAFGAPVNGAVKLDLYAAYPHMTFNPDTASFAVTITFADHGTLTTKSPPAPHWRSTTENFRVSHAKGDLKTDKVGFALGAGRSVPPDGEGDVHLTLTLSSTVCRTIISIAVTPVAFDDWNTDRASGKRYLGVFQGGKQLNLTDKLISVPLKKNVPVTFDLYGAYEQHPVRWDPDVTKYTATVDFEDGGRVNTLGVSSGGPTGEPDGCGTAAIGDGPTDAATSLEPDTRKDGHLTHGKVRQNNIPDFWVGLSSDKPAVIVGDTLGIGSDGALTVATSNEQLLTIHVFERATGCLIQGAWVELWDPHGKLWSPANQSGSGFRTRFQSRAGVAYMGGLKLTEPGLYHLWVYALDAQGKVVTQAWLPLQVKDRKGESFVTVNGRPFSYEGSKWVEGTRATASAFSTQAPLSATGNLFSDMYAAFQSLLSGITSGAQQLFSRGQTSAAQNASTLLGAHSGTVSAEGQLQKVYRTKTIHLLPSFLVSGLISPDHPRLQAAEARPDPKARLIGQDGTSIVGQDGTSIVGQDGTSLIGQDGTSLIGQDGTSIVGDAGASLIMNDRGRLVAAGGNIVATDGATAVGNSHGQIVATDGATLSPRAVSSAHAGQPAQPKYGACALGYKTVGKGMTRLIEGTRVLARDDGTLVSRSLFIGARNAMPVNAPAAP